MEKHEVMLSVEHIELFEVSCMGENPGKQGDTSHHEFGMGDRMPNVPSIS